MSFTEKELALKAKELELRERELTLREKEMTLRQKELESRDDPTPEQVLKLLEVMIQAREIDLKELKYQDKKSLFEVAAKIKDKIAHPLNAVGEALGAKSSRTSADVVVASSAPAAAPILTAEQLENLPAFQGWVVNDCWQGVNEQCFATCSHIGDNITARIRMNGSTIEKIESIYPDISVFGGMPYYGTDLSEFADYIKKVCREFGFAL